MGFTVFCFTPFFSRWRPWRRPEKWSWEKRISCLVPAFLAKDWCFGFGSRRVDPEQPTSDIEVGVPKKNSTSFGVKRNEKNTQLYDPKMFGQILIGVTSYTVTAFIRIVVASSWCGWILDGFCWSIFVYEWVFVDSKKKHISYRTNRNELMFLVSGKNHWTCLHPGRLTWNLQITHLERKMIFQTSMIMFHGNLQGGIHMNTRCYWTSSFKNSICPTIWKFRSPADAWP